MFSVKAKFLAYVILSTFAVQTLSPVVLNTYALNTTYYVDATLGSDANTGGLGSPWKTLSHVSTQTFSEGDQVLLKCGETWTDTLILDDVGAPANEIQVGTYGTCSDSSYVNLAGTGAEQIYIGSGASHIRISGLTFSGGSGIVMENASHIRIGENTFTNISDVGIRTNTTTHVSIENNYIALASPTTAIGVKLNNDTSLSLFGNTFSGGLLSIDLLNSEGVTTSSNIFYKPSTYAVSVTEDATTSTGKVQNNLFTSNTFLTYNVAYPMIHIEDQNDTIGTLATMSANTYLNVYKSSLPLVEVLGSGASTNYYDKNAITVIDSLATTFTAFAYTGYIGNETRLLVNTGASPVNKSCPGGICPQYVGIDAIGIVWPTSVGAHSSKIILWNNAPNTIFPPSCTLDPSPTSIPNGGATTLTWTTTGAALGVTLTEPTATGGTITSSVSNNGSGTYHPPIDDQVNHYILTATNTVGSKICPADITAQNSPPVLVEFFLTGSEDASYITGTLEATDSIGDTIYFEKFTDPISGTMTLDPETGAISYTPNPNFCGTDTFQWRAFDQNNRYSDPSNGVITVTCVNDAPIITDDVFAATGGVSTLLDVAQNDIDLDTPYEPQVFTLSGVSLPMHGTLVLSGTQFEYLADFAYFGSDSFLYVVLDQSGAISNTGTVNINVTPGMNLAPTVSSGIYMLNEDDSVLGTFSGSDLNRDILSFSAVTLPTNGILTIMGTGFSYVPTANFNGSDSFNFVANDGFLDSNMATMTLNVNQISDVPVAVGDTINVQMNTMTNIDVVVNDTDGDNPYQPQTLTLTGISTPTNGTASIVGNEIQYTPTTNYLGSDTIEYVIEDQDGNLSNTGIVNITVSTTNQYPVADSGSYIVTEDIPLTQTLSGSDPDLTPVTFVLDTDVSNGTLVLSATGEFTYTPDADYNGTDSFTFHVTDGIFDSNPIQTVTLTVTAQNDNPFAVADAFSVSEDGYLDTTILINDSDADIGDTFVINSITSPINGTAVMTGNLVTYTPNSNYCGMDTFEYTTIDLSGATSNVGSVTMTINCINDTPSANNLSFTATGNIATSTGNIIIGTLSGTDIDAGDMLTYAIVQDVLSGTLLLTGSTFSYEGDIDFIGTDTFTYTTTDLSGALSNTGTVTITVVQNDYNAVPIAFNGGFSNAEDMPIYDTLSGSDAEGVPLIFVLDQDVVYGSLTISSTGALTYIPNANYNGTQIFTFYVTDGVSNSNSATGIITIGAVNDAPVANPDIFNTTEDVTIYTTVLSNDYDVDNGDIFTLNSIAFTLNGIATITGGIIEYIPSPNYCGTDTFGYTIIDGSGAISNTGSANVNVSCVNDAPTATGETVSATEDTPILIPVLANDIDTEGSTLSVANLTQPGSGGTVAISGTGVIFTPTANFCTASPTTFTYQARDTSSALSTVTTVTISSIACINDAPISTQSSQTMTGNIVMSSGTVLSGGILTGYLATHNTLNFSILALDIENDSLSFTAVTLPAHGTMTLSSTGLVLYTPIVGYIGTDVFTYTVSDGSTTTEAIMVNIVVQDPYPPAIPIIGAGGGGGVSSSLGSIVFAPIGSAQTHTGLISELLLTNKNIIKNSSTGLKSTPKAILAKYNHFMNTIKEVIHEAQFDTKTGTVRVQTIRKSGQQFVRSIRQSLVLTSEERTNILTQAITDIEALNSQLIPVRDSGALNFIIRIMKRERTKIEKSVNAVTYLITL